MKIIGFDFSIKKPACCIYDHNFAQYRFVTWPKISDRLKDVYRSNGVEVIDREDPDLRQGQNLSVTQKMVHSVECAGILAGQIAERFRLEAEDDPDLWVLWEGLSYGSSGNVALDLSGYKYIVMDRLKDVVSLSNQVTYAPQTIKKVAGCSHKITNEKGKKVSQGKPEMIEAMLRHADGKGIQLVDGINLDRQPFRKKGDRNWIDHLDDIVDSYWLVQTFIEREILPMGLDVRDEDVY